MKETNYNEEFNESYLDDQNIMDMLGRGDEYKESHPKTSHVFDDVDPNTIEKRDLDRNYLIRLINNYCSDTSLDSKVDLENNPQKKKELKTSLDRKYEGASSIEKKFDQYFKLQAFLNASAYSGNVLNNNDPLYDKIDAIDNHFKKIMKKASIKAAQNVFSKLQTVKLTYCDKYKKDLAFAGSLVPKDDPHHKQKSELLAVSSSESTMMIKTALDMTNDLNFDFTNDPNIKTRLFNEYHLANTMTMGQVAEKFGFKGAQKIEFLQKKGAKEGESLQAYYTNLIKKNRFKTMIQTNQIDTSKANSQDGPVDIDQIAENPTKYFPEEYNSIEVTVDDITNKVMEDIPVAITFKASQEATKAYAKKKNRTIEQVRTIEKESTKPLGEINRKGIEDWAGKHSTKSNKGEIPKGKNIIDVMTKSSGLAILQDHHIKPGKNANYQNYVIKHTGYKISRSGIENASENLAKLIAAMQQAKVMKSFNLDETHKLTNIIKQMPSFNAMKKEPVLVACALSDAQEATKYCDKFLNKVYGITPDNVSDYIEKMSTLYDSMQPVGSQSTEYKNFKKSVEDIKNLKTKYDLNTAEGRNTASRALTSLNINMINTSEAYMKGKKSVRTGIEGQRRFNNSLDALGILCTYSKDAKSQIQPVVDRINQVRNVKRGNENYVDINNFNEKRAKDVRDKINKQKAAEQEAKQNAKKGARKRP
jgi:hypothetical protein